MNLILKDFKESNIVFTEDGWINATATAQNFGKDVRAYTRSVQYKNYSKALAKNLNCVNSAQLQKTLEGRSGGTFLHPKLAIDFARWISPDFAIWCDEVIAEILNRNTKPKSHLEILRDNVEQLIKHDEEIKELQNRQDELEAKVTTIDKNYYTLIGWHNKVKKRWNHTLKDSQRIGREMKKLSLTMGYEVLKEYDAKYGEVNTYHQAVLQAYFEGKQ